MGFCLRPTSIPACGTPDRPARAPHPHCLQPPRPMANPARPRGQVVGVSDRPWGRGGQGVCAPTAPTGPCRLRPRRTRRADDDHGVDGRGADEGEIHSYDVQPALRLEPVESEELAGGDPQANAALVRGILDGKSGAHRDIVVLNAGPRCSWRHRPLARKGVAAARGHRLRRGGVRGWTAWWRRRKPRPRSCKRGVIEHDPRQLGRSSACGPPDDEAYLSAATMAAAVDAGQPSCASRPTRGEAGSLDHVRWPPTPWRRCGEGTPRLPAGPGVTDTPGSSCRRRLRRVLWRRRWRRSPPSSTTFVPTRSSPSGLMA